MSSSSTSIGWGASVAEAAVVDAVDGLSMSILVDLECFDNNT